MLQEAVRASGNSAPLVMPGLDPGISSAGAPRIEPRRHEMAGRSLAVDDEWRSSLAMAVVKGARLSPVDRFAADRIPQAEVLLLPARVGAILFQRLFGDRLRRGGFRLVVRAAGNQAGHRQSQQSNSHLTPHAAPSLFLPLSAAAFNRRAALPSRRFRCR